MVEFMVDWNGCFVSLYFCATSFSIFLFLRQLSRSLVCVCVCVCILSFSLPRPPFFSDFCHELYRYSWYCVSHQRNKKQPDPEEFLDEILHEVGEARDSSNKRVGGGSVGHDGGPTENGGGVIGGGDGGTSGGRPGGGGATKYSLSTSAVGEYDPTFIRLNRTEHEVRRDVT